MISRALILFAVATLPMAAQSPSPAAPVTIEGGQLVEALPLQGTLFHVQGMDLDANHIWVTSVDTVQHKGYLHQFNRSTGAFERQVEVSDGERFHPGGFSIHGDSIWVPVAEYKPNSSGVLTEIDRKTLTIKRRIPVSDHLGCVAIAGDTLIAGNWGSRRLYVLGMDGKQIRTIENPSADQFQDIKFVDGMLVGSGNITHTAGAVEWYAWPSMKLVRTVASGLTDRGRLYTEEGMALQGNDLYLVPEDGPSRLFHFVLPAKK